MNKKKFKENPDLKEVMDEDDHGEHSLTLHNDDIHSFDYVIDSLIEVCQHDSEQAEQCAFITHYKGKCDVKKGTVRKLKFMKNKLISRGLSATID